MRKKHILIILSLISALLFNQLNAQSTDELNLGAMVQPVPLTNRFLDSSYFIWCCSVCKGNNNKYYMLYSRWPKKDGYMAWVINAEIAVAVSDYPQGPYKHIKVVLPARGKQYWDGDCTLNPTLLKYKGKYYLYYMGLSAEPKVTLPIAIQNKDWWAYRNKQRIGVAVADRLDGDWKRFDHPVIDVSADSTADDALLITNPGVAVNKKGKFVMVYKEVGKNGTMRGSNVKYGVATSNSPIGGFVKESKRIFERNDGKKDWMIAEDPFLCYYHDKYYAIVRDVVGRFTGDIGAWALLQSDDGIDWKESKYPKVVDSRIKWEDGTKATSQLERPCLLIEKDKPTYLFGAYPMDSKRNWSGNVAIPLKGK